METVNTRAVILAILEKIENGQSKVFIQNRWKPKVSLIYSGLLEIPTGGIEAYENEYDALKREVKEDTGIDIARIIDDYKSSIEEHTRAHDSLCADAPVNGIFSPSRIAGTTVSFVFPPPNASAKLRTIPIVSLRNLKFSHTSKSASIVSAS